MAPILSGRPSRPGRRLKQIRTAALSAATTEAEVVRIVSEQVELDQTAATASAAAFDGRRVVVRTLDAGADEPLKFADLGPEENPALGRRGLRPPAERPDVLDAQLETLAIAARETGADVRVMAPMVGTAELADLVRPIMQGSQSGDLI